MNNETITKKQHYIPQFLLKKWSVDGKRINCIMFENDRTVKKVPMSIIDAFEAKYLYGKSCKFEECLFANYIEPNFCSTVDEIRVKKCVHDKRIQDYILYQLCRTKFIVDMCVHNEKVMAYIAI